MDHASQSYPVATKRTTIGLYDPEVSGMNLARWRINGYPAFIIIWTTEEWERLPERPADAQYYSCGVWCALRMA
jgi:hypothetical protein